MPNRRAFIETGLLAGLSVTREILSIENEKVFADLIIINAKIATQNTRRAFAESAAVKDGKFVVVGKEREIIKFKGEKTRVIDAQKRCVIPGLNDSYTHPIRGGLNYNPELRRDGVDSLADALSMLKIQAQNTPAPQWVRVVGGLEMYDETNRPDRMEAFRLWTVGSSWFSGDANKKGSIEPGRLADLAILSKDFFTVAEEEIKSLESILTIVGGKIVYASNDYKEFAPPAPPVSPDWSPVKSFGGYKNEKSGGKTIAGMSSNHAHCTHAHGILTSVENKARESFSVFGDDWGFACACAF